MCAACVLFIFSNQDVQIFKQTMNEQSQFLSWLPISNESIEIQRSLISIRDKTYASQAAGDPYIVQRVKRIQDETVITVHCTTVYTVQSTTLSDFIFKSISLFYCL